MPDFIRLISDVHGNIDKPNNRGLCYFDRIKYCEHSIQLGDMGFDYSALKDVDPEQHRFFKGNHDYYSGSGVPHELGDFGSIFIDDLSFFFIRGAFSIDRKRRFAYHDWFPEEQLSYRQCCDCIELYQEIKPDFVLSHTCPTEVALHIGEPDRLRNWGFDPHNFKEETTQRLLQTLFEIHKPTVWCFGHFHMNVDKVIKGTRFICREELGYVSVDRDGEICGINP